LSVFTFTRKHRKKNLFSAAEKHFSGNWIFSQ
jgi:hypothetical protein